MDISIDIDAMFSDGAFPQDKHGCLALIATALAAFEPAMLWIADEQGHTSAAYAPPGHDDPIVLNELVGDFASRLGARDACHFPHADTGGTGFLLRTSDEFGVPFLLGGLLGRWPDDRGDVGGLLFSLLACCAALVNRTLESDQRAVSQSIRVSQLQAERDTLKSSYTGTMASAMEERERRLKEQSKYTEHLEREVAKRSMALREALAKAESANQSKSDFLANMSHEIRTPMTAILGYTDLLIQESWGRPQSLDWLDIIRRNGKHLLAVINDILDISKIESGKMQTESIVCSSVEMINEITTLMRPRAIEQGLEFSVGYSGSIPKTIKSDPTRLRQILMNLIGNAIKFTSEGSVCVTCRLVAEDTPSPRLQFAIADTGIGLTPDQLGKLFQPFSQADTSTTRRYGGSGLGLSISRHLALMLGGNLVVTSDAGKGSTFVVSVETGPLTPETMLAGQTISQTSDEVEQQAEAIKPKRESPLADVKALLAEDGVDNQRLISTLLKRAGAEVDIAENGLVAYEKATDAVAKDDPYHVIFMDMQMPVLDGYSAVARLRKDGYAGPIIALTAHAMSSDRQKCLDAGCDDYATKPIQIKKLIAIALQHLHLQDGARRSGKPGAASEIDRTPPVQASSETARTQPTPAAAPATAAETLPMKMADQVRQVESAIENDDLETLRLAASHLKNGASAQGLEAIAGIAERLAATDAAEPGLSATRKLVEELVDLCGEARPGQRPVS